MKYRDDEYEYESRRREMEQRRRVRPDAEMTSQRRRNQAGGGRPAAYSGTRSASYGTRGVANADGARRPVGERRTSSGRSTTGARNVAGGRSASGVRAATGSRSGAGTATGRRIGADPYDRSYSSGNYEGNGRTARQATSEARRGKRPLSQKAKKKRRIRRILFAVEGVLLLVVLGCLFVISKWDKIQKASFGKKDVHVNELSENTIQSMEGYRTIAIFGADEEGSHSDVIMIANIDNKTKEVTLTSILRDTFWNVPDLTKGNEDKYAKANNAYHTGGDLGALNALNKNLDLNITEYVTVNWYAVSQVVDLLGGMEIDVPESMMGEINGYITNTQQEASSWAEGGAKKGEKGTKPIDGPGLQTLDGLQTVAYCRIRHNNGGDDGRTRRQREVVTQILEKAKSAGPGKLLQICEVVFPEVRTNLTLADVISLAPDVGDFKMVNTIAFPYHQLDALVGAASVKVPLGLADDVAQLHMDLFGDDKYEPSPTVQQISKKIEELTDLSAADRTD
ncbi:MAG: LCP family protein [Lachnospiraceae bacterium]|nr:LCP family protein [Lachnospiraceae bacterium]